MSDTSTTRLPLTDAQAGVWYAQQIVPDSPVFNVGQYTDIPADLDVDRFIRAVESVVRDSETLRSRPVARGDTAVQEIRADGAGVVEVHDLTAEADPRHAAAAWMRRDMAHPVRFDTDEPLVRYALLRVGERRWYWYQRYHHILVDAYAVTLLARRVADVYTALGRGQEPPPSRFGSLADIVADETAYAASEQCAADRAYWTGLLGDGYPTALLSSRPQAPYAGVLRARADVAADVLTGLTELGERTGATWADTVIASSAAYLSRMTGHRDVVLGIPVMGRLGRAALRTRCGCTSAPGTRWNRLSPPPRPRSATCAPTSATALNGCAATSPWSARTARCSALRSTSNCSTTTCPSTGFPLPR